MSTEDKGCPEGKWLSYSGNTCHAWNLTQGTLDENIVCIFIMNTYYEFGGFYIFFRNVIFTGITLILLSGDLCE